MAHDLPVIDSQVLNKEKIDSIREKLKDENNEVRLAVSTCRTLILGDYVTGGRPSPEMCDIRDKLIKKGYPALTLDLVEDKHSDLRTLFRASLKGYDPAVILMIDGKNSGVVFESSKIMDNSDLQEKTILLVKKEDMPKTFEHNQHYIHYPHINYYENAGELVTLGVELSAKAAYRKAKILVEKRRADEPDKMKSYNIKNPLKVMKTTLESVLKWI